MYICLRKIYKTMTNLITYKGTIHFDPVDKTKKHKNQANWKRIALVLFDGDICEYYSWFLLKRYNIKLNKPLRGAHVSMVNDSVNDMLKGLKCSEKEAEIIWNDVKNKYDNKSIDIVLDLDVRTSGEHWWLNVKEREKLSAIRTELGLNPNPYFGLHMSIGYSIGLQKEHSEYILRMITNFNAI